MEILTTGREICGLKRHSLSQRFCTARMKSLALLLLTGTIMLSACGGGNSSSGPQIPLTLSGNWQFTMAPPSDGSFLGGLQGGFLLQNNGVVTGAATYSVSLPNLLIPCNTGSAAITGSISGQSVKTLVAVAGTQTFTLTGTLSLDGLTMAGTYTSTAGTAGDGSPCGTAQPPAGVPGLQWSAVLVPPLTGSITGSFHSTGGAAGLDEQDFLVTGALNQAANTGTSNATVTGNLSFLNTLTNASDYPCFTSASLYGQISGNSVTLEMFGTDGSELGLIGEPVGSLGSTGVNPVTLNSAHGGYVLQGDGPSYLVATTPSGATPCPGSLENIFVAGDFGNICFALSGVSACQQPITLTPSALIFPAQVLGSPSTAQTITLANASGTMVGGVALNLTNSDGVANFTETDTCGVNGVPSLGQPFDLIAGQSCVITITFAPLETCAVGTPAAQCPSSLNATLVATSSNIETIFTVPITGNGVNAAAASTRELDNDKTVQTLSSASNRIFHDVEHHAEIN
jgi:hypothetical protein